MRRILKPLISVVALVATLGPGARVLAGDLPGTRSAPAGASMPMMTSNWAGFYGGLHLGYGFGRTRSADLDGFVGGGQVGINFQSGQFVYGSELDLAYGHVDYRAFSETFQQKWLGSGRARLGYAFERFLPFITGGFAFTNATLKSGGTRADNTHFGYVIGIGGEMMLTDKISANVQFLHFRFGSETYNVQPTTRDANIVTNQLRVGVNYRF
ncbi:outer membrane protein [Rhabdaerophilum calidifontis]|uniref:outer membrane protein n=1 Tax=Rhabdaerophilum calidifontis TaxID=2604328 RepID=UPI0012397927|nr:outer membrane protein [Rhabdaerophilum calidifontis]